MGLCVGGGPVQPVETRMWRGGYQLRRATWFRKSELEPARRPVVQRDGPLRGVRASMSGGEKAFKVPVT